MERGKYRANFRGRGGKRRTPKIDDYSDTEDEPKFKKPRNPNTNRKIEKNGDVFRELRAKQNPALKNVDAKIFNELDKFKNIVSFISERRMKNQTTDAFFELCKVFTLPDLRNCKEINKQSSIYAIFFDGSDFVFYDVVKDIAIQIFTDTEFENEKILLMFDFFKVLIDVSTTHSEMLQNSLTLLDRISQNKPALKKNIEDIQKYSTQKEEDEINSFESAVSPTADDLFHTKKISNIIDKPWKSFKEYKKTMIDLTKENFYMPFRNSLSQLKEGTLDARDLFLYQDVFIAFTSNIDNYAFFKECNFFLSFKIRSPPNWKKPIRMPDWKRTDQLGNRSLLILSTSPELLKIDAVCRSCAMARSANYEQSRATIQFLNHGIVPVVLISGQIKENVNYYMFEPTSCWPAVQPVLQRLLKMSEISFPSYFLNKVIKLDFSDNRLDEKNVIKTDVLSLKTIPEHKKEKYLKMATEEWAYDKLTNDEKDIKLRVDHEQYKALRYALIHNLTLVNGAPGTGKTHFAREYLRVMTKINHSKPIAVVTFTNHALDSILEGILDFVEPEKLMRWGGQMRSTNETLMRRQWKNYYLSRDIRDQKNEIVTMKQNLKNMYNIRQMSNQCTAALNKNPKDTNIYKTIMSVLNNFFRATKLLEAQYPIDLTPEEIKEYNLYQNNRNDKIKHQRLPDELDALECWLNGRTYYEDRNEKYREILKHNREVVNGPSYHNKYEDLKDDDYDYDYDYNKGKEEEEEEYEDERKIKKKKKKNYDDDEKSSELRPSAKDFDINSAATNKTTKIKHHDHDDDEEEEEEEADDKIYNDEDIIEMTRVSFDGTEISEQLPKKYIDDILVAKFKELFVTKNKDNKKKPYELMKTYLSAISEPLTPMIQKLEEELQKDEIKFNESETREAGRYLQRMQIIGMTSTVASVRKEALEVAECEILIIEEAGELTESMLSCILPSTLKRLILIGDYQQLRPKVEYEMTKSNRNYDISLFEKLVVNAKQKKDKCLFTLSVQRRMHPQISSLIRNVFYDSGAEKITDADSTNELGIPYGIPHRVQFILHNHEEDKVSTRSHVNKKEAKFVASLVPFFICRGYKAEDITIISLYKGQMYEIQKEIETLYKQFKQSESAKLYDSFGNIKNPRQIKVVVLDNFQGEENKVIIVSLTRSNKPGFVENRNRALVTLSRAREMLVVVGNERIFGPECKNNEFWKKASKVASELSPYSLSIGKKSGLIVNHCPIHTPHSKNEIHCLKEPNDILRYRFTYCKEECKHVLPCGHECKLVCHCHNNPPGPHEHDDYYCQFTCSKRCPNGHRCTRKCGICTHKGECPPCNQLIDHVFEKCGHEARIKCYLVTSGKAKCTAKCGKKIEECGHTCSLQCGHKGKCDCKVKMEKECVNCRRTFKYNCGDPHPKCCKPCNFTLPCGHLCSGICCECYERGKHIEYCEHQCDFVFPCGHRCEKKCCDVFPIHHHFFCQQKVLLNHNYDNDHDHKKQICMTPIVCDSKCQHYCQVCNKSCNRSCSEKCIKRCNCKCPKTCNECGAKCRCLAGEKCAIFCQHSKDFAKIEEPPEDDGILFVFHDNHFLPLDEAKRRVKEQYMAIVKGEGDIPIPIRRLTCPCDKCKNKEPCILGSWLFDKYNKEIEKLIERVKKNADRYISKNKNNDAEKSYDKVHWYVCENCDNLFFVKFSEEDNIVVKCPNCGTQKGEMFE